MLMCQSSKHNKSTNIATGYMWLSRKTPCPPSSAVSCLDYVRMLTVSAQICMKMY
jgi:hypothetical protein